MTRNKVKGPRAFPLLWIKQFRSIIVILRQNQELETALKFNLWRNLSMIKIQEYFNFMYRLFIYQTCAIHTRLPNLDCINNSSTWNLDTLKPLSRYTSASDISK